LPFWVQGKEGGGGGGGGGGRGGGGGGGGGGHNTSEKRRGRGYQYTPLGSRIIIKVRERRELPLLLVPFPHHSPPRSVLD